MFSFNSLLLATKYLCAPKMEKSQKIHCLLLPFPATGHMNPVIQFSKLLQQKGITPTLITTKFMFNSSTHKLSNSFQIDTISDGYDEGGIGTAESSEAYATQFKQVGSKTLADLIEKHRDKNCPDVCIIYDPHLPWVLDVAKEYGLIGTAFFTQSCAVDTLYYRAYHGLLPIPTGESEIMVPGLPMLKPMDMPSFLYAPDLYPAFFDAVVNQFSNLDKADWLLCNTFYNLEEEAIKLMEKIFPFKAIGPTVPSFYLDGRIKDDKDYGISMHIPSSDTCINWLNQQQTNSVVYVSFGSLAELGISQMEELALGLKASCVNFLWVVRESEKSKIPKSFLEEISECKGINGIVVSWCPQLEVLAHEAIGCFLTHCGWNSTLEALSLGVPLVAMPQWTDQMTNAKYVVDVWRTGVRVERDEVGLVRRGEIERCVREVVVGKIGIEIRGNARKWKVVAQEAAKAGGSSDRNIDEFVAYLVDQATKVEN